MPETPERSALARIRAVVERRGLWSDSYPPLRGDVAWHGSTAYSLDSHIEGRHFPSGEPALRWVGRRAVIAACSDIVAAGALPQTLTIGLSWPGTRPASHLEDLYEGVADACETLAVKLTGGDWQSADRVELHCAVSGALPHGARALWPAGQAGDLLVISHTLGDAYIGRQPAGADCRMSYQQPVLALEFAAVARQMPAVHGMTDITDGLLAEVALIARNSALGARIDLDTLPRHAAWGRLREPPTRIDDGLAYLLGSDEYGLLACVAPEGFAALRTEVEKSGHTVYAVGLLELGNTLRCSGSLPQTLSALLSLESLNQIAHTTWQLYAQS